jgi:DNA repair exonuclease SbcCD nuclease subunit
MLNPVAVLISDIHYNLQTLPVADAALRMAVAKANELNVPLVVAGDLHDSKANLRAECMNAMLETFRECGTECYILRGNHDQINEKSNDHALTFLNRNQVIVHDYYPSEHVETTGITVVVEPMFVNDIVVNGKSVHLAPYHSDPAMLVHYLNKRVDKGSAVIMHQGVSGSNSGEYIQDRTALPKECFKDFRVVSGHYHARQTIRTSPEPNRGYVGTFDYIGNPFTLNFAEANDPPKGFQILNDDGSLTFVPTNLRKHVVVDLTTVTQGARAWTQTAPVAPGDIIKVRARGPSDVLATLTKDSVAETVGIQGDYRLELCPDDLQVQAPASAEHIKNDMLLDQLIDSIESADEPRKERLKSLWKTLIGD